MLELSPAGVLFDLDGVLVDSASAVERHWHAFAARRGLQVDHVATAAHGRRSADVIAALVPAGQADAETAWFEALEISDTDDVVALPGAVEVLAQLPTTSWGIVTSCGRDLAVARLDASGLPIPRILISADDVAAGKPDPQGYLLGSGALGVPAARVVVFEDAPAGAAAGRAAGRPWSGSRRPARLTSSTSPITSRTFAPLRSAAARTRRSCCSCANLIPTMPVAGQTAEHSSTEAIHHPAPLKIAS